MFERNSSNSVSACRYRLVQEAAHLIEPYMGPARKVSRKPFPRRTNTRQERMIALSHVFF